MFQKTGIKNIFKKTMNFIKKEIFQNKLYFIWFSLYIQAQQNTKIPKISSLVNFCMIFI